MGLALLGWALALALQITKGGNSKGGEDTERQGSGVWPIDVTVPYVLHPRDSNGFNTNYNT